MRHKGGSEGVVRTKRTMAGSKAIWAEGNCSLGATLPRVLVGEYSQECQTGPRWER